MNSSLKHLVVVLMILFLGMQSALAEKKDTSGKKVAPSIVEESRAFLFAKVDELSSPKSIRAYLSFSGGSEFELIEGIFLEHSVGDETGIVWGASLKPGSSTPISLILIIQTAEDKDLFFVFQQNEFSYFPAQSADEVRARIALLREEVDSAKKEKERLEATLLRLKEDAQLIGGYEKVGEIERRRDFEAGELRRVSSQLDQLKKSIEALKRWKDPADLPERKRVLIKDIQELQKQ